MPALVMASSALVVTEKDGKSFLLAGRIERRGRRVGRVRSRERAANRTRL